MADVPHRPRPLRPHAHQHERGFAALETHPQQGLCGSCHGDMGPDARTHKEDKAGRDRPTTKSASAARLHPDFHRTQAGAPSTGARGRPAKPLAKGGGRSAGVLRAPATIRIVASCRQPRRQSRPPQHASNVAQLLHHTSTPLAKPTRSSHSHSPPMCGWTTLALMEHTHTHTRSAVAPAVQAARQRVQRSCQQQQAGTRWARLTRHAHTFMQSRLCHAHGQPTA
jgi:hypothetical protein